MREDPAEAPIPDTGQELIDVGTTQLLGRQEEQQATRTLLQEQPPIGDDPVGYEALSIPYATPEEGFGVKDVANFLVGDEMAMLGMKLDKEGFDWSVDHIVEQWSEEPLWLNILTAGTMAATLATGGIPA